MGLEAESAAARVKLRFESVSGTRDNANIQLDNAYGDLLLKLKGHETAH